jgi:hypothetical protein
MGGDVSGISTRKYLSDVRFDGGMDVEEGAVEE